MSWLSFNERVLQEAMDEKVPLIERMRFLGIFSSNLDEFFRVRVATLSRMELLGKKAKKILGETPRKIIDDVYAKVIKQQSKFEATYKKILNELESENIFIINEKQLKEDQSEFVKKYFRTEVRGALVPIMIDAIPEFPYLKDRSIYLAILLSDSTKKIKSRYALIEVPSDGLSRFLVLPEKDGQKFIILLDDIIRLGLKEIFSILPFDTFSAYTIKITRDSEIAIEENISESLMEKISKGIKQRKKGKPVRFSFDHDIDIELLHYLLSRVHLKIGDDNIIPGGRYHNFKDFMQFPVLGKSHLIYKSDPQIFHTDFEFGKSLFSVIKKKDILVHYPYHSFEHFIDMLREAAIDPKVSSIKITMYRLASKSKVVNALINAVKNGKHVTVVMELQARFDEEANIKWSDRLREEGVHIILGVQGLKVHSKMCLITRKEKGKKILYANISSGNYNENTSRVYSDHALFTADKNITVEIEGLFSFLENNYKATHYTHSLVAPMQMRKRFVKLIENEIENTNQGIESSICIKLNNLADKDMVDLLQRAAKSGVKIKMIIRGTCALQPDNPDLKGNIEIISIVDRYLEHSRFMIFSNRGKPVYYLSSADWMVRNLDLRIELAIPLLDKNIQEQIKHYFELQWNDNVKARVLNNSQDNKYYHNDLNPIRSQEAIMKHLKKVNLKLLQTL